MWLSPLCVCRRTEFLSGATQSLSDPATRFLEGRQTMLFQRSGQVTALIYGKLGGAKSLLMVRATPFRGILFSRERQRLNHP